MFITNKELAQQCNGTLVQGAPERALRINTIHSAEAMDSDDGEGITVFFEVGDTGMYFDILDTSIGQFTAVMNRIYSFPAQEQHQ